MRKWLVFPGGVTLLAGLWAVWWFGFHGLPPAVIFFPPQEPTYPAALDEFASIDVTDMPLNEVLRQLSDRHHVEILWDDDSLKATSLTGREPVTGRLANVRLRVLLELLVRQVDDFNLMIGVRDGRVYVAATAPWYGNSANYAARAYPLASLLAVAGDVHESEWSAFVRGLVPAASWPETYGRGLIKPLPGTLLVSQTLDGHRQIERALRRMQTGSESLAPPGPIDLDDPDPDASARVVRILNREAELDCWATPLADALAHITSEYDVPVWHDRRALRIAGVTPDALVTCTVRHAPLRAALREIVEDLGLACYVRGGALIVTDRGTAGDLFRRLYPIADLLLADAASNAMAPGPFASSRTLDELPAALMGAAPADLICAGAFTHGMNYVGYGYLSVTHTWGGHQAVTDFLQALRSARRPELEAETPPSRMLPGDPVNWQERCEQILQQEVALDFAQQPLATVARDLEHKFGLHVRLPQDWPKRTARRAPPDAVAPAAASDPRVTFSAGKIRLEAGLRRMLRPLGLTLAVRDGTVLLAGLADAEAVAETRIYRYRHWADSELSGQAGKFDHSTVVQMLTAVAALNREDLRSLDKLIAVRHARPTHERIAAILSRLEELRIMPDEQTSKSVAWADDGGVGEIRFYPVGHVRALPQESPDGALASASEDASRADWYTAWEATKTWPIWTRPKPVQAAVVAGLDLPARVSESDVATLVRTVVRPTSWRRTAPTKYQGDGTLGVLPGVLVILQSPEVHNEIAKFLAWLAQTSDWPLPWGLDTDRQLAVQAELLERTRTTNDPLLRAYGLTLLAAWQNLPEGLGRLAIELLNRPETRDDPDELFPLGIVLERCAFDDPDLSDELVRRVANHPKFRQRLIRALLVANAATTLPAVFANDGESLRSYVELSQLAFESQDAVPLLLRRLAGEEFDAPHLYLLTALDPDGRHARTVLARWREIRTEYPDAILDRIEQRLDAALREQEPQQESP